MKAASPKSTKSPSRKWPASSSPKASTPPKPSPWLSASSQSQKGSLDNSLGIRYNRIRAMPEDFSSYLPLSPATLHILLALAAADRHGYGIMQEVARQSGGHYKIGPGTLYDNLQKLMTN